MVYILNLVTLNFYKITVPIIVKSVCLKQTCFLRSFPSSEAVDVFSLTLLHMILVLRFFPFSSLVPQSFHEMYSEHEQVRSGEDLKICLRLMRKKIQDQVLSSR